MDAELHRWEIPGRAVFESGSGGLTRLAITTPLASAHIYLLGAHVAHFQPAGSAPVLFMSSGSFFAQGKPIRGGVPVCWPWFGARAGSPQSPPHGFARTMLWDVESIDSAGDTVTAVLRLSASERTRAHWPHEFVLRHRIAVGAQLEMTLETENSGAAPFQFEEALHTYFAVGDVRQVSVTGLENTDFIDKVGGAFARRNQGAEPIQITGETDRVYANTRAACVIDDPSLSRRIAIEKSGSDTTVVWNPWIEKAKAMPDFADDEWPQMLCVETTNSGENAVTLAPGARHSITARIAIE